MKAQNIINNICLEGCSPKQILNINSIAFNDISNIKIFDQCGNPYDMSKLEYSYSMDNVCWSCYMGYEDFINVTDDLLQDFYLRLKVAGQITKIEIDNEEWNDYSTQIDSEFNLTNVSQSSNLYNPYINLDCAITLYQNLTESISNMIGIGCYYFKLSPNTKSRDLTFKEYALMDVSAVKQIKLIINDNQMPSSKPEFNDFGLDWQSDWEVEVSKATFATAFGNKIQPMEGDLVYIPMMKRMWMVNGAWEEKKDAFMWNATTFKLSLVKYQEKASVDLGDTEALVNSFVKNKYDDLFGDEENIGSGFNEANADEPYMGKLYQIYECDSVRKSVNVPNLENKETSTYYKGTLISDMEYKFILPKQNNIEIEYQYPFCGENATISFVINTTPNIYSSNLIKIGNLTFSIKQTNHNTTLCLENIGAKMTLLNNVTFFVWFRWDKVLNVCDMGAAQYKYNQQIPLYKLQPAHYWYDIDNPYQKKVLRYNIELNVQNKSVVNLYSFYGTITNIKIFDIYVDDISEVLQMYPTHSHLLINDTARKLVTPINGSNL